jgi:hypothetical protein
MELLLDVGEDMLLKCKREDKTTVHPVPTPVSTVVLVSNKGWRWGSKQNLMWQKPTNYNRHNYEENYNKGVGCNNDVFCLKHS